jgi:hypothetical protein
MRLVLGPNVVEVEAPTAVGEGAVPAAVGEGAVPAATSEWGESPNHRLQRTRRGWPLTRVTLCGQKVMSFTKRLVILLSTLVGYSGTADARVRLRYEDATVVERSELIVIGRLEAGSVNYVPHKKGPNPGSWEHHVTLVIADVLKGSSDSKRISIVLHYGLDPRVGGVSEAHGFRPPHAHFPKEQGAIYILYTGAGAWSGPSLVSDAGKDNLWFLRKRAGTCGEKPGTGKYSITDPEDLQPLKLKPYFLLYLSEDPEPAIREYARKNPDQAERAQRYLDHLEIQRILKIKDREERFDKLLPFFLRGVTWNEKPEARDGIVSCGTVAGERLRALFDDVQYKEYRKEIILMWRDTGYGEVVPLLIELLKKHDRFWAREELEKGWWNTDVGSERTRRRRDIYGETYYGVCALRSFRDPKAKEVLEITRDRWKALSFENPQIVEECDAALRELAKER